MKLSTYSALALVQSLAPGYALASPTHYFGIKGRSINAQTQQELASVVSNRSVLFGPDTAGWAGETERWMANIKPNVRISIKPGTEEDVAKIVKYANSYNLPFYAVNRGHSYTTDVAKFDGIEIDLKSLQNVQIAADNRTATLQGGVYGQEVINYLWDQGFVTATGTCSCVGLVGPALGGGHGLQQGKHGLTSDHFVSLNVVLANGTAVRVSDSENTDLWWAMRGAGHNFGIVTSFEAKIWPDNKKDYYYRAYQFLNSTLEPWLEEVNKLMGNGTLSPDWLGNWGVYGMNETLSTTEPTVTWTFLYDGWSEWAKEALKPFDKLNYSSVSDALLPYKQLNDQIGGAYDGDLCKDNYTHVIGTAGLQTYNLTSMRSIYELYAKNVQTYPDLGNTRLLVEGYSVAGVRSFAPEDSAYPLRDDYILTYFDVRFDDPNDSRIGFAQEWRRQTIDLWNAGQPDRKPTTYVNYAAGGESLEARYGYESWRLERLRKLKAQYDPDNKFAWYNPIVPPNVTYQA